MKVLAVIPARGGSRGVPHKNTRMLAGLPLLAWSIRAAQPPTRLVDRVVVSSDSPAILAVAERFGAETIERPAHLATDEALTDPVIVAAVRALEVRDGYRPDLVVLLQPTVPSREIGLVDRCIERLLKVGADSLLTGYPLHFVWRPREVPLTGGQELEWVTVTPARVRRQDVPPSRRYFHEDGSVYVTRTDFLEQTGCRVGGKVELLETARSIDIDTEADFRAAEAALQAQEVTA